MAQKVELRKRSGGSFAGNDNLMLPVTHVNFVLGLLDGNDKLNTSLLPSSMLNTKRMAGSINADTNFASLYTLIETFNESNSAMYPGTYFISNGKNFVNSTTSNHVIYYNDDGLPPLSEVTLENGDHLFYVKHGTEYTWNITENTLNVPLSDGVTNLEAPYNTISGRHIFATKDELNNHKPTSNNTYGLVTGYKWVEVTSYEYDTAGHKIYKSINAGGRVIEADANELVIPTEGLWEYGQSNVVLKINDTETYESYWKLTKVDPTFEGPPKIYQSLEYSNKHIWGVVNNSYDLATTSSPGLMSATDKTKLNSLSNYVHHSQAEIQLYTSGVDVLNTITVNGQGHTTEVSKRTLPNASTSAPGVMSAADKTKLDGIAVNANKYSHPTQDAINANTVDDGQSVIDKITVNTLGHVTEITTRQLTAADTDKVGVVELATSTEAIAGTDANRALTPSTGLSLLNYHQDMSYFSSLTAANSETLPDGATAIIVTGTITI